MKPLPIACTLTKDELRSRRADWSRTLRPRVRERVTLDDGYAFRFEADSAVLSSIMELIDEERICCGFLEFVLRVTQDQGPVWLEVKGPNGTKAFVEQVFET